MHHCTGSDYTSYTLYTAACKGVSMLVCLAFAQTMSSCMFLFTLRQQSYEGNRTVVVNQRQNYSLFGSHVTGREMQITDHRNVSLLHLLLFVQGNGHGIHIVNSLLKSKRFKFIYAALTDKGHTVLHQHKIHHKHRRMVIRHQILCNQHNASQKPV